MPKYNWVNDTGLLRDARADLGDTRNMQALRALDLNGTNQYGHIPVDQVQYPFSIFCWADTDSASSLWLLNISDPSNASRYFCLGFDDGNLVLIGRRNTTEFSNSQVVPLVTDWFSCVAVFQDSTTVVIYRNGTLLHTFSGLTPVSAGVGFTRFAFGTYRTASPGVYWNGRVKNCGFLRRAATLADAQEFHVNGIIYDAEVFLPLEDNSTTIAYNIGSSSLTNPEASLVNSPVIYENRDVPFSLSNKNGYSTRNNLFLFTEQLSNAYWTKLNTTTNDATIETSDPLGSYRACKLTVSSNLVRCQYTFTGRTTGEQFTFSCYVKAGSGTSLSILISNSGETVVSSFTFNCATGAYVGGNGSYVTSRSVSNVGNGWFRLVMNITIPSDQTTLRINTPMVFVNGQTNYVAFMSVVTGTQDKEYQRIGSDPGISVLFPSLLSDSTKSAARDNLTYRGVCPNNAQLLQSACFNFDGVDDYISIPSLTGSETVSSKQGTSSLTISSGRIDGTAGTLYNLKLSNGMYLPCSEGGGSQLHCVNTNQAFDIVNGQIDNWETQDDYHYNILEGFSYKDELLYDNETLYYDGVILTYAN